MSFKIGNRSLFETCGIGKNIRQWLCFGLMCGLLTGGAPKLLAGVYNFQATIYFCSTLDNDASETTYVSNCAIYVPPAIDVPRIRGVIILIPGTGGDWRFRVNDTVWQEAARSLGFALVGSADSVYAFMTGTGAQSNLNNILTAAAAASGRAELVNAPIVVTGFSSGGFNSTEWARRLPSRTLAIVAQHGGDDYTTSATQPPRNVPSLWLAGSADTTVSPDYCTYNFTAYRGASVPNGQAALAIDWLTGHDSFANQGWSMAWTWIAESIALRYPANTFPSTTPGNPITLLDIPLTSGWLGLRTYVGAASLTGSDRSAFCPIAPYASYGGVVSDASWLPNETVARVYQALNSTDSLVRTTIPLQGPLAIVGDAAPGTTIQSGQTNPPQMAVWTVGSTINLTCATRGFGGSELVTLSGTNLISNGDFSLWTSGKPNAWTGGTAGLSQGPDLLSSTGTSAVLCNNASLQQTFSPLASDFQMRFTFTINLTSGTTGWNQPLVLNLYQANQTVNPAYPWMTFQFAAADVSAGPFTIAAYTANTGSSVILAAPPIVGSTYNFAAGAFTGAPAKYDFVLNYFAATNTYSVSCGPSGGPLVSSGQVAYFRNPTNATFGGVNSLFFYSYVNGLVLDGVSLSPILSAQNPVKRMDYYDGATLIGTQMTPVFGTWSLPYTLATQGIHSLTVVATDSNGNKTSALRTVVATPAYPAHNTFYYRFEASPGLLQDHYDVLNLTRGATLARSGTTGAGPIAYTLPATGPGSEFPLSFDLPFGTNNSAAQFVAANYEWFSHADSADLPSGTTPFTIEAFVNLTSGGAGAQYRCIAAHGEGSTTNFGWHLVVTGEGSGLGARRLALQLTSNGQSPGTLDTINSNLQITPGVDYYVACVINPADLTSNGITFYVKDLTNGGSLTAVKCTHTKSSIFDSTGTFVIGAGWDGLIDEPRLTKRALGVDELLVNQVTSPLPPGLPGWRYTQYGTLKNSGSSADLTDPDESGVVNLMRYGLGLPGTAPRPTSLPHSQIQNVAGTNYLAFTFTRPTTGTDVTYTVQTADNVAGPWTDLDPLSAANQISVTNDTPTVGVQTITVKDTKTVASAPRRFMRLRVTKP